MFALLKFCLWMSFSEISGLSRLFYHIMGSLINNLAGAALIFIDEPMRFIANILTLNLPERDSFIGTLNNIQ